MMYCLEARYTYAYVCSTYSTTICSYVPVIACMHAVLISCNPSDCHSAAIAYFKTVINFWQNFLCYWDSLPGDGKMLLNTTTCLNCSTIACMSFFPIWKLYFENKHCTTTWVGQISMLLNNVYVGTVCIVSILDLRIQDRFMKSWCSLRLFTPPASLGQRTKR